MTNQKDKETKDLVELKEKTDELVKYLCEHFNPHVKIIIDHGGVTLIQEIVSVENDKYL